MGFEYITMQSHNGKNTTAFSNKLTDILIAGIIKAALR